MICQACARAADISVDPVNRVTNPEELDRLVDELHALCRGGTWCDCRHAGTPSELVNKPQVRW